MHALRGNQPGTRLTVVAEGLALVASSSVEPVVVLLKGFNLQFGVGSLYLR